MDKMLECVNDSLETLTLDEADLSLEIFISILLQLKVIVDVEVLKLKGHSVFANSLLGTTIQDGSTRERSNV